MGRHQHASQLVAGEDGAAAAPTDGLTVPIPAAAQPGILEHTRQVADAAARRDAYLSGMLAGLGLVPEQGAEFDLETWTIRVPTSEAETPAGGR